MAASRFAIFVFSAVKKDFVSIVCFCAFAFIFVHLRSSAVESSRFLPRRLRHCFLLGARPPALILFL